MLSDEKSIKTFSNATKSAMSLIKSRLDISNLLSTKKKPCCDSNKKAVGPATAGLVFSLQKLPSIVLRGYFNTVPSGTISLFFSPIGNSIFSFQTYLLNHCQLCQVAASRSFGFVMPCPNPL